jgi:hypothetical protein
MPFGETDQGEQDPNGAQQRSADARRGRPNRRHTKPSTTLLPEKLSDGSDVELSSRHRAILRDLVSGLTNTEVAARNGVTATYVAELVRGRQTPRVRAAFQKMLELQGLSIEFLAEMAATQLEATQPRWNAASQGWDFFPDNNVRFQVWRHLTMLYHLAYPDRGGASNVQVVINTNLGDKTFTAPVDPQNSGDPNKFQVTLDVPAIHHNEKE